MADEQQFCLRWNNFPNNFTSQFDALRTNEEFVDVTLTCEGRRLTAHKLVLSACSPYFKQLFKGNPCKHPIMFLHNVEFQHLKALVEFMYVGEVKIAQTNLQSFLRTAESLQIRGLAESHARFPDINRNSAYGVSSFKIRRDDNSIPNSNNSNNVNASGTEEAEDMITNALHNSKRLRTSNGSRPSLDSLPSSIHTKLERRDFSASDLLESAAAASAAAVNPFLALENAVENVHSSGLTLQGALDAATSGQGHLGSGAATNQNDVSLNDQSSSSDGEMVKPHSLDPRPCPECGRVYSNISNLRQHIRLIHYPECIACPLCFKPFKNKLYLKRHLISYHELLPPSYMEKRYQFNSIHHGGGGHGAPGDSPAFPGYKLQPSNGFLQRHHNNHAEHQPPPPPSGSTNHMNFAHNNHIMPVQAVLSSPPPPPPHNFYQTPPTSEYNNLSMSENGERQNPSSLKRSYSQNSLPVDDSAPTETNNSNPGK